MRKMCVDIASGPDFKIKKKETCIGLCKKYQNLLLIRKDSLTVITNFESKWKVTRRCRYVFLDVNTSKKQTCGSSHLVLEQSGSTIGSKFSQMEEEICL